MKSVDNEVYVNLKLKPDVRKALKIACANEGMSYSEYLEKLLKERGYWKEEE